MSVTFTWHRGFPPASGLYLVELSDGEMIVTHWNDGSRRDDGEPIKPGWDCLTWAHITVKKWTSVNNLRENQNDAA